MSHWVQQKQHVLKDCKEKYLREALRALGLDLDYSVKQVSNSYGDDTCEAAITRNGIPLSLGINFNSAKELVLVGDFFGLGLSQEAFLNNLAVEYQRVRLIQELKKAGWTTESITGNANDGYDMNIMTMTA